MKCPLCRGNMKEGKTTLPFEFGHEKIIVVKNVPARVCEQCGEAFVNIVISKKVEKMISKAKEDSMTFGFLDYPDNEDSETLSPDFSSSKINYHQPHL